jgi:hypothetical protein
MIWYKINRRWWVDLTQVRCFGMPKDQPKTITIEYKDGHEDHFSVENTEEEFAKLEKFVQRMFEPIKVITSEEGELPFGMV